MIGEITRIMQMRERLFRSIEDCLREDGHHKSYEGALEISMSLPNYFEQYAPPEWSITLDCYLLIDEGRHKTWRGKTLAEAIALAEADVERWCMPYEMERFGRQFEDAPCD